MVNAHEVHAGKGYIQPPTEQKPPQLADANFSVIDSVVEGLVTCQIK